MTERKINTEQARQIAYAITGFIPDYIKSHLDEYKAFCAQNGYCDAIFENNDTEAD